MRFRRFLASCWISALCALLLSTSLGLSADQDAAANQASNGAVTSPDGRFVFRQLMEPEDGNDSFGIYDQRAKSFAPIDKDDSLQPMGDSLTCVWAPDSRHFALNARSGARYDATQQFEWTGKKFRRLPDVELPLMMRIEADRKAQVQAAKLPKDTHLTRIWDGYTTLQWKDGHTLLVSVSSIRHYLATADKMNEFVSAFTFTVRLNDRGRWKVIDQTPSKEMTKPE